MTLRMRWAPHRHVASDALECPYAGANRSRRRHRASGRAPRGAPVAPHGRASPRGLGPAAIPRRTGSAACRSFDRPGDQSTPLLSRAVASNAAAPSQRARRSAPLGECRASPRPQVARRRWRHDDRLQDLLAAPQKQAGRRVRRPSPSGNRWHACTPYGEESPRRRCDATGASCRGGSSRCHQSGR